MSNRQGFMVCTEAESEMPYGSGIPDFKALPWHFRVFVTSCNGLHLLDCDGKDQKCLEDAKELANRYIKKSYSSLSVAFIFGDTGQLIECLFDENQGYKKLDSLDFLTIKVEKLKTVLDALQEIHKKIHTAA